MRLFNLGLPKSGTTTLHTALVKSGLNSAHWKFRSADQGTKKITRRFVGEAIYSSYLTGGDPLAELTQFDAITQPDVIMPPLSLWPQMDVSVLSQVREHHPTCLFLMLTRSPEKVADSMLRWSDLHERLKKRRAPGLSNWHVSSREGLVAWISSHYDNMRDTFGSDKRFLEVDIADHDASEKLSHALGVEIKWWGKANVNTI
ncbi:hypothetical protein CLV80_106174 [Yoonia maritima]|uniref:Sulfotransferase family protein n=1 Tax=Yoonia maritima TaxID=1435347 RepID=A0A2T0VYR1_9RHOB|nr:sulfotransferase family protein [Yoonia maritima]PRY77329.1 hypothetical protein CLV80_106174 [Yoonia maritima]